ncbi:10848_t:CDS:2, partial [Acaulospora colombiana]
VLKARAAFLSNYEVYALLKEMEGKQLEQTRAFMATKKEENLEDQYKGPNYVVPEDVAENVRTIQVELLQYLSGEHLPTSRQSEESVAHLTKGLRGYGLTKAEKLQIINLCPQSVLDLYVIVEEMEARIENKSNQILALVQDKLSDQPLFLPEESGTANNGAEADEPAAEEEEGADMWGGEEVGQYLEEEFEEGGDDFEPMLEIDEVAEPQD